MPLGDHGQVFGFREGGGGVPAYDVVAQAQGVDDLGDTAVERQDPADVGDFDLLVGERGVGGAVRHRDDRVHGDRERRVCFAFQGLQSVFFE